MSRAAWTTEQEKLLLLRLEQGKKVKEIAAELNVSPKRVSNKIQILKKSKTFLVRGRKSQTNPGSRGVVHKKTIHSIGNGNSVQETAR